MCAASFQVARNALQRGLMPTAGPWGATLVRFLFGLPFSLAFFAVAVALTPGARPSSPRPSGARPRRRLTQVLATAALLVAMRRAGSPSARRCSRARCRWPRWSAWSGITTIERPAWVGVAVTTLGLAVLTWPRDASGPQPLSGALFGLVSGLCFGFSLNAFRHAGLALEPHHPVVSALTCVAVVQAVQALGLALLLGLRDCGALRAVVAGWRHSLGAGLCGALASAGWFVALTLTRPRRCGRWG